MSFKFFRGLTKKLIVYFVFLAILPPMALVWAAIRNFESSSRAGIINQLRGVAELKASELDRFFEEKKKAVEILAASRLLGGKISEMAEEHGLQGITAHEQTHDEVRELLKLIAASDPTFVEIFFISPDGEIHISSDETQEGKLVSRTDYFIFGKEATSLSDIFFSLRLNTLALTISTPFYAKGGELGGVIVGQVNLENINNIMREDIGMGETAETYLVNSVKLFVTDPRLKTGFALKKPIYTAATDSCVDDAKAGSGVYKNYDDVAVFGAYRWLSVLKVCLLAEVGQSQAMGPISVFRGQMAFIGGAMIIVIAGLGFFVARSITRPIRALQRGAEELGLGNLDYRVDIKTGDETEQLAKEFNQMAEGLKQSRAVLQEAKTGLEKQVASRTRELKDLTARQEQTIKERTKELQKKIDELEKFYRLTVGRELTMIELKREIKELKQELENKAVGRKLSKVGPAQINDKLNRKI